MRGYLKRKNGNEGTGNHGKQNQIRRANLLYFTYSFRFSSKFISVLRFSIIIFNVLRFPIYSNAPSHLTLSLKNLRSSQKSFPKKIGDYCRKKNGNYINFVSKLILKVQRDDLHCEKSENPKLFTEAKPKAIFLRCQLDRVVKRSLFVLGTD